MTTMTLSTSRRLSERAAGNPVAIAPGTDPEGDFMSTLASITVNQCDGCEEIATLQSDESYSWFAEKWHDGYAKHFCPECKDLLINQRAINEDNAMAADMAAGVRQYVDASKATKEKSRQDASVPYNGH